MKKILLPLFTLFCSTVFSQVIQSDNSTFTTDKFSNEQVRLTEDKEGVYFISENSFFINRYTDGLERAGFTLSTANGLPGQENYKAGTAIYSISIPQCFKESTNVNIIDSNDIVSEISSVPFRGPNKINVVTSAICTIYANIKKNPDNLKFDKTFFRDSAQNSLEKDWTILSNDTTQSVAVLNNSLFVLKFSDSKEAITLLARYNNLKTGQLQFRKLIVTAENCQNKSGVLRVFLPDNSYEGIQKFSFNKPNIFTKTIEFMCKDYLTIK